jgi:hypothetical protein
MGEASRRRAALQGSIPPADIQDRVHKAVMRTIEGFGAPGVADCLYHAASTVGALRAAGMNARMVAGPVWWAVGPGPGDIIVHGYDQSGRMMPVKFDRSPDNIYSIHTWAVYDHNGASIIVDMTTYQIPDKARRISEVDGMPLSVTIPVMPYYWGKMPRQQSFLDARPGDWCCTPVPGLAEARFPESVLGDFIRVAGMAYRNPEAKLDLFDLDTGQPVAEALSDMWSDFDGPALVTPPDARKEHVHRQNRS